MEKQIAKKNVNKKENHTILNGRFAALDFISDFIIKNPNASMGDITDHIATEIVESLEKTSELRKEIQTEYGTENKTVVH
ncbi:hypothetical protein AAGG74_14945 [Bacillus mexicanus]|uniref:hypothetical protein n=1 Tax=Bacillus mexicanus TaxID=2834415 RepID=UPI003D1BC109